VQIPPLPDHAASNFFWIALPTILTLGASQWLVLLANRKRGREKDNRLAVLLDNYRLHEHGEWKDENSKGPLNAENMRFPRDPNDRS